MATQSAAEKQTRKQAAELAAILRGLDKLRDRASVVYSERRIDTIAGPLHESLRHLRDTYQLLCTAQAHCAEDTFDDRGIDYE